MQHCLDSLHSCLLEWRHIDGAVLPSDFVLGVNRLFFLQQAPVSGYAQWTSLVHVQPEEQASIRLNATTQQSSPAATLLLHGH